MIRRRLHAAWLLSALTGIISMKASAGEQPAPRPNIVFIMVDDMGYRNLGCFGGKTHQDTQHRQNVRGGDQIHGLLLRRRRLRAGAQHADDGLSHRAYAGKGQQRRDTSFPEDVTVADVLKKAGYVTGGFGKWGLGNQGGRGAAEKHGFDTFFGYYNQVHAHDYYTSHLFRNSERVELNGRYSHYAIHDETIKFIKESAEKQEAVFLLLPVDASSRHLRHTGRRSGVGFVQGQGGVAGEGEACCGHGFHGGPARWRNSGIAQGTQD